MTFSPSRSTLSRPSLFALLAASTLLAFSLVACGSDEKTAEEMSGESSSEATASSDDNSPPVVNSLEISPEDPISNTSAEAEVDAHDEDGDRLTYGYEWKVNGSPFGKGNRSVHLRGLRKGDELELTVVVSDGHSETRESTSTSVGNTPPQLTKVRILVSNGEVLAASADADDLDHDTLSFAYQWFVNDDEREVEGPELDSEHFDAGDNVVVEVVASDGEADSERLASDPHRVQNSRPIITSNPQDMDIIGGTSIQYQISAKDPDPGQTLRYRLEEGPDGMYLDVLTGRLSWTPAGSQVGEFAVRVVVEDQHGGEVAQAFTVNSSIE